LSVSLGQLDNRVFQELYAASEYLILDDIHNAVVQELNIRTMQSRTSDINVLLGTSAEFTADVIPYDVTSLIGKAVPCWVETQAIVQNSMTWWYPIRSVNLAQFNDYQRMGTLAAAFHGDETSSDTAQPVQYLSLTFLTGCPMRIRFDRDSQRIAMDADQIIPDNISELVVLGAQQRLIPRIKIKLAMRLRNDEVGRAIAPVVMGALDQLYAQNSLDMRPLEAQWRVWAFRDRGANTAFNKPTPSGANLYPGGRNNTWGGYGSW
jgi:hypothetical protein